MRLKRLRDDLAVGFLQENFHASFGLFELLLALVRKLHAFFEELHGVVERKIGAFEALHDFFEARERFFEVALFAALPPVYSWWNSSVDLQTLKILKLASAVPNINAAAKPEQVRYPQRERDSSCSRADSRQRQRLAHRRGKMHNPLMALEFTTSYMKDATDNLRHYKRLAERAFEQVPDEALVFTPDAGSNSIAIIVKHLSGNMRSRWRDFLTTDGEKPDRNRDAEFEQPFPTRAEMMAAWEAGWKQLFDTLATLTDADLPKKITIRGEAHSVMQAITRQNTHIAYHVGQIVYLAKQLASENGKFSACRAENPREYNATIASGKASQR